MPLSLGVSPEQELSIASQNGQWIPQFMRRQANELILETFCLHEGRDILVNHQRGAGACFCSRMWDVFAEQGQSTQIHWHCVSEHWQRGAIGVTNDLLVRLHSFTAAERAHHRELLKGQGLSISASHANLVGRQKLLQRLA